MAKSEKDNQKCSSNILHTFIIEKSMEFTGAEIIKMIDMELEKAPSEMNVEFIDLCLDTLINASLDKRGEKG